MFDSIIKWGTLAMSVVGAVAGSTAFVKNCKTNKKVKKLDESVSSI